MDSVRIDLHAKINIYIFLVKWENIQRLKHPPKKLALKFSVLLVES
jgi:hypothetical protein